MTRAQIISRFGWAAALSGPCDPPWTGWPERFHILRWWRR